MQSETNIPKKSVKTQAALNFKKKRSRVNSNKVTTFRNPDPKVLHHNNRIKTITGELVPADAMITQINKKLYWNSNKGRQRVYFSRNIPENKKFFYDKTPVPEDLEIYGETNKYSVQYVIKNGVKIPVFTQGAMRKFQFTFAETASEAIPRNTSLMLKDGKIYTYSGKRVFHHRTAIKADKLPEARSVQELLTITPAYEANDEPPETEKQCHDEFTPFIDFSESSPNPEGQFPITLSEEQKTLADFLINLNESTNEEKPAGLPSNTGIFANANENAQVIKEKQQEGIMLIAKPLKS